MLEDKVAVTNCTKGKLWIILGTTLMISSVVPPIIYIYNHAVHYSTKTNSNSIKNSAIVTGVIFGAGLLANIYGKIKHWYWNS